VVINLDDTTDVLYGGVEKPSADEAGVSLCLFCVAVGLTESPVIALRVCSRRPDMP